MLSSTRHPPPAEAYPQVPRFTHQDVALGNAVACGAIVDLQVHGVPVKVSLHARPLDGAGVRWDACLSRGDRAWPIRLAAGLGADWFAGAFLDRTPLRPALVAEAVAPVVERVLGDPARPFSVSPGFLADDRLLPLQLVLCFSRVDVPMSWEASVGFAGAEALEEACRRLAHVPVRTDAAARAGLAVPVRISVAQGRYRLRVLRGLRPGDWLLPAGPVPAAGEPVLLLAGLNDRAMARGRLRDNRFEVEALMKERPVSLSSTPSTPAAPAEAGPLDDIEVQAEFIVGTLGMTAGALAALRPGQVIALERSFDQANVEVHVGRRCIARGRLVAVDRTVAVQLEHVEGAHHAGSAS